MDTVHGQIDTLLVIAHLQWHPHPHCRICLGMLSWWIHLNHCYALYVGTQAYTSARIVLPYIHTARCNTILKCVVSSKYTCINIHIMFQDWPVHSLICDCATTDWISRMQDVPDLPATTASHTPEQTPHDDSPSAASTTTPTTDSPVNSVRAIYANPLNGMLCNPCHLCTAITFLHCSTAALDYIDVGLSTSCGCDDPAPDLTPYLPQPTMASYARVTLSYTLHRHFQIFFILPDSLLTHPPNQAIFNLISNQTRSPCIWFGLVFVLKLADPTSSTYTDIQNEDMDDVRLFFASISAT